MIVVTRCEGARFGPFSILLMEFPTSQNVFCVFPGGEGLMGVLLIM